MKKLSATLVHKIQLTHDVYELTYSLPENPSIAPWQYMMFQLEPWLNRSYSIASFSWLNCTLIVKRISDGKGSPRICDASIGDIFQIMIPLGHFILKATSIPKCFIGTGTGFAPLFSQINATADMWITDIVAFIFGVRNIDDIFYEDIIRDLGEGFLNFKYEQYLSRDEKDGYRKWYVTDWITKENIENFGEFYICGSPIMVRDARTKLEELGIQKDNIFFEQF